jgi:hypothetical protein
MADRPVRPRSIIERDAAGEFGRLLAAKLSARKIGAYRHAAHVLGLRGHSGVRAYIRGDAVPGLETIHAIALKLKEDGGDLVEAARRARAGPALRAPGGPVTDLIRRTVYETLAQLLVSPANRDERSRLIAVLVDADQLAQGAEETIEVEARRDRAAGRGEPSS